MSEDEGVIRYRLDFTEGPEEAAEGLDELVAWRRILRRLGLLGQDPGQYAGLGFGNISRRLALPAGDVDQPPFFITGSQTGGLAELGPKHFATVIGWDIDLSLVVARGPIRPSSEALTHAAVYAVGRNIHCVIHVHSPEIWRNGRRLAASSTPASAAGGTAEMARQVQQLVRSRPKERLLIMEGHPDGVIAWGETAEAAGVTLLAALARAFRLEVGAGGPWGESVSDAPG